MKFVDAFAGCGGMSLGLSQAGWTGLFAVEHERFAFQTLEANFLDAGKGWDFEWPRWLPQEARDIVDLLQFNARELKAMGRHRKVKLVCGAPPCQGFSSAGRRKADDPRNQLFRRFVELVDYLSPDFVLLENVEGIHRKFLNPPADEAPVRYSALVEQELRLAGYATFPRLLRAADFGVPQLRPRYILVGIKRAVIPPKGVPDPFYLLERATHELKLEKGLPLDRPVTAEEALSDLHAEGSQLVPCPETKGFKQVKYAGPRTAYQKLMRVRMYGDRSPNSLRLANHRPEIVARYRVIQEYCVKNGRRAIQLQPREKEQLGIPKQCLTVLDGEKPAATITTIPDDLLHYSEPRILSIREQARLQSFPDLFDFCGKFTTGGRLRKKENPRYTQVGNATPPLMVEAIGRMLLGLGRELELWDEADKTAA